MIEKILCERMSCILFGRYILTGILTVGIVLSLEADSVLSEEVAQTETHKEDKAHSVEQPDLSAYSEESVALSDQKSRHAYLDEVIVTGVIKEVAADLTYVILVDSNGEEKKILTGHDFLQISFLEVNDTVDMYALVTDKGYEAYDYQYVFGLKLPVFE